MANLCFTCISYLFFSFEKSVEVDEYVPIVLTCVMKIHLYFWVLQVNYHTNVMHTPHYVSAVSSLSNHITN